MAWDSVPWFVGGGAQHSPEIARVIAYAAFGGAEGIVGAGDLKVLPLTVPGAAVRVEPGAAAILNKASGGTYQSYAGRLASEDTVSIAATGSGAGRSDLIVARVEDPYMAGEPWADPTDPTVGPYIFTRVIAGVAAGTTTMPAGMSGIPLARIDIPASTATITAAMIHDLRSLVAPRRQAVALESHPTSGDFLTTETTYTTWPDDATTTVNIPSWATKAIVRGTIATAILFTADWGGFVRVKLGTLTTEDCGIVGDWSGSPSRFVVIAGSTLAIPANMRGTTQTISFEGKTQTVGTGKIAVDSGTSTFFDIEFIEESE